MDLNGFCFPRFNMIIAISFAWSGRSAHQGSRKELPFAVALSGHYGLVSLQFLVFAHQHQEPVKVKM